MAKYWQGEVTKGEEIVAMDFPRRSTKEDAFRDAETYATGDQQPSASEWEEIASGESVNTGRSFVGGA